MGYGKQDSKKILIENLFRIEDLLAQLLSRYNCRFVPSPDKISERLNLLPENGLFNVLDNLNLFLEALKMAEEEDIDPWNDFEFLNLSMRQTGLNFHTDFKDVMTPLHVVEGYDMNRRQIFRNLYFMEISNYSLLEVLTYDWPMLFHRDKQITDLIIQQAEQDMWTKNQIIESNIPLHHIRELLSENPQLCEVRQKYFAPLFAGPNVPGGILVVSSARPIGPDKNVDRGNLAFLNS